MSFPDGFLWGTATSAHQVEGGNVYNDSWLAEHLPGSHYAEPSGDACDHYHRYESDIALIAGLGLGAYRFSLEWSRIEPEDGEFSRAALDHYRRMLDACHEHGLTPFLTFHHFTSPRWIAAAGGWEERRTAERFARFCERAMRHLGDLVPYACTLNEPNLGGLLHGVLGIPAPRPGHPVLFQNAWSPHAVEVMRAAHGLALEAIKGVRAETSVGLTVALTAWDAMPGGEAAMARLRGIAEDAFLDDLEGDFIGVQNYTGMRVGPDGPAEPAATAERTQMGYVFQPRALGQAIRRAVEMTGLPVFVTENGVATDDDERRVQFISRALASVESCLLDGLDVRGYFYWSLFDNFEWVFGYRPTFGLVAVDRATQERTVKPSARHLGEIARANGLS
ncbi:MAG TPA: family 1 glycosylhydrolase [Gaiellales bacterium]|nr:family 1 glycosylhydrolase [Gaiellales bacterium]